MRFLCAPLESVSPLLIDSDFFYRFRALGGNHLKNGPFSENRCIIMEMGDIAARCLTCTLVSVYTALLMNPQIIHSICPRPASIFPKASSILRHFSLHRTAINQHWLASLCAWKSSNEVATVPSLTVILGNHCLPDGGFMSFIWLSLKPFCLGSFGLREYPQLWIDHLAHGFDSGPAFQAVLWVDYICIRILSNLRMKHGAISLVLVLWKAGLEIAKIICLSIG